MVDEGKWRALTMAEGQSPTPAALAKVARSTSEEAARWAFGQWELRKRAKPKFESAERMLFVREALEQATHERVAVYHASLFPAGALVADLTAGIGADLIALASRGPALGFELDAERAEYARFNSGAEVREEDSLAWLESSPAIDYVFVDPARRVEGRRTLDLGEFSPDPRRLSEALRRLALGAMKLSPMLRDEDLEALGPRLEFVSFEGECREALVISGRQAEAGRFAVHIETNDRLAALDAPPSLREPGEYLYDADPAAVRAHATGELCRRFDLRPLGDSIGYLTGATAVSSPWFRGYRVLYHGKADPKTTKKALRELGAATPELKQRGAGLDLVKERKNYSLEGRRPVSLAIWSVGKSLRHAILERVGLG